MVECLPSGVREMAQWVKHLLCKHEGLRFPRTHIKAGRGGIHLQPQRQRRRDTEGGLNNETAGSLKRKTAEPQLQALVQ